VYGIVQVDGDIVPIVPLLIEDPDIVQLEVVTIPDVIEFELIIFSPFLDTRRRYITQ